MAQICPTKFQIFKISSTRDCWQKSIFTPWGEDAERNTRFNQARVSLPTFLLPPPLLWLLPRPPLAPLLNELRGISPDGGDKQETGHGRLASDP
jgi:hypothetical protein